MIEAKHILTDDSLKLDGINHGFFTRGGGISEGIYKGLNCGSGSNDNPDKVQENRNRVAGKLKVASGHLLSLYQIHSAEVVTIDSKPDLEVWNSMQRPKADGFATKRDDIALGILTADCGPVLFADEKASVIGACHAGWKGAIGGVMENTVNAMEKLGANRSNIKAVLGPCIHQHSYEVGSEFVVEFVTADSGNTKYFSPSERPRHSMFDLPSFILDKLATLNLASFTKLDWDTRENEDLFYSYRRTTLAKEPDYGRQISAISLAK
ncbi:peptidoglycan editing factor PgeF [Curvivirga sp.]|uniref:peptidoglycan editing factor PgeF n=1 Tax=Curvivirga sp. TaxID=2856848 RepID=UPI003B5C726E